MQFLEVPHKHWLSAVEGTVLSSVNAFHFSIVCVLVAFLQEVRLGLFPTRQTRERILLIWMHLGGLGADASVVHPGVMMVELFSSGDLSD